MNVNRFVFVGYWVALGVLVISPGRAEPPVLTPPNEKAAPINATMKDLMAAFEGESNAHARYTAFAKKADEEGFTGVGSLFRAAARAEQIHANSHAEVIRAMGGEAKADIKEPDVRSTAQNLQAAIDGESYERDTMYPEFFARAKKEGKTGAMRTFNFAMTAEAEHAKLFTDALKDLEQWRNGKRDFFVCTVCGFTTAKIGFEKCPSCFSPKEKYEKIN